MKLIQISSIFIFLHLRINCVFTFNMDTKHPIIINNLVDGENSHFGITVSLLTKTGPSRSWAIIGAPKANSSRNGLLNTVEPGKIWRCSLGRQVDSCEEFAMDPEDDIVHKVEDKDKDLAVLGSRNDSWLGGAISDDGKTFVACSHRWKNVRYRANVIFMNGACYKRPISDLTGDAPPQLPPKNYMLPLSGVNDMERNAMIYDWPYGQAGGSVHISGDKEMIIGAPGVYSWRGTVIKNTEIQNVDTGDTHNAFLVARPELLNGVFNDSYIGYSVSSGNYFNPPVIGTQYVTGAPRGNYMKGLVLVFQFPTDDKENLIILQELKGEQAGSYFGHSVCTVDVNGDGLDDLVVGSPHFSIRKNLLRAASLITQLTGNETIVESEEIIDETKFQFYGDEGAVYVFVSDGKQLVKNVILTGNGVSWSRFGSAISSIGDLNRDGFNDIAIGSPYENDGHGSVYIYHGSKTGVSTEAAQIILGKDIDLNLRGFGYSLSKGVDIDNNGYNDLAIGSYESEQIVILRTRPLLKLDGKIETDRKNLALNSTGFDFKSCVSFEGGLLSESIVIVVKVEVDVGVKPPRVLFKHHDGTDLTHEKVYDETLRENGGPFCTKFTAVVNGPLRFEKGVAIKIRQEIAFVKDDSKYNPTRHIIRNNNGPVEVTGEGYNKFCTNCQVDSVPMRVTSLFLPLAVDCGPDEICMSELSLKARFVNLTKDAYTIGESSSLTIEIELKNYGEPAVNPTIQISWLHRNLILASPDCKSTDSSFSSYNCTFGAFLSRGESKIVSFEFDMSDLIVGGQTSENSLVFNVAAFTISEMLHGPVSEAFILPLVADADIAIYAGDILAITLPTAPLLSIEHKFNIHHRGLSPVAEVILFFNIPVNLTSTKTEIIQIHQSSVTLEGEKIECTSSEGLRTNDIDSDEFSVEGIVDQDFDQETGPRKKRAFRFGKSKSGELKDKDRILFDCSSIHVTCVEYRCKAKNFRPSSHIVAQFTLALLTNQTRTLFDAYKVKLMTVKTEGRASIVSVDSSMKFISTDLPDFAEASTIIQLEKPGWPSWAWGIGVISGFFILVVIIYCCYACIPDKKKTEDVTDGTPEEAQPLQTIPSVNEPTIESEED